MLLIKTVIHKLSSVSQIVYQAITPDQFSSFTLAQVESLTQEQRDAASPEQIDAITSVEEGERAKWCCAIGRDTNQ